MDDIRILDVTSLGPMVKRGIPEFRAEFRNCNGNGNGTECSVTAVKNGVMVKKMA